MIPTPSELDQRLQKRYRTLVEAHLGQAKATAAGLRSLPSENQSFAALQAAWRFWHNLDVTLPVLAEPLLDFAHTAVSQTCQRFALVVHDWSHLNYAGHSHKHDRLVGAHAGELGYDAHVALLLNDTLGQPLTPLYVGLQATAGVYDSRFQAVQKPVSNLDGLQSVFAWIDAQGWSCPAVHLIDREADSVGHYRSWHQAGHCFVVRADAERVVLWEGQEHSLPQLTATLQQRHAFLGSRPVEFHGTKAYQEIAEVAVVLHRPAHQHRVENGKKKKRQIRGVPLPLRLVITRIRNPQGELLAEWLLLTNVPADVTAEEVALWYYWRWRIESYFKLLKSAGLEVEHWLQKDAAAITRRLLVAAMACTLVWQIARNPTLEGKTLRKLLIQLSGRQMGVGVEYTEPALLAGLWVLLAMRQTLEQYSVNELRNLAALATAGFAGLNSG